MIDLSWWQGLVLGIVQGATEYLPVSSSGHLAIAQLIFGLNLPVSIDVLLHLATLIPTIWIFRKKLISLLRSFVQIVSAVPQKRFSTLTISVKNDGLYISLILIVTLFTFVVAFPQKELNLKFQPVVIGFAFLGTALLLCMQQLLRRTKRQKTDILSHWPKALLFAICIGIIQGIAALPGVSRSGITISFALLFGLKHREAGEFSFIISIPVIVGALILDSRELLQIMAFRESGIVLAIALAFVSACISGFLALHLLLKLLSSGRLYWFSIYLFFLAAFTLWYFA